MAVLREHHERPVVATERQRDTAPLSRLRRRQDVRDQLLVAIQGEREIDLLSRRPIEPRKKVVIVAQAAPYTMRYLPRSLQERL
jgi:hypothetical protein